MSFTNNFLNYITLEPKAGLDSDIPERTIFIQKIPHEVIGQLSGTINYSKGLIELNLAGHEIEYQKIIFSKFKSRIALTKQQNNYIGSIEGTGSLDRALNLKDPHELQFHNHEPVPVTFSTKWDFDGKTALNLDNFILLAGKSSLHGSIQFFFYPLLIGGKITGEIDNLQPFSKLLLTKLLK